MGILQFKRGSGHPSSSKWAGTTNTSEMYYDYTEHQLYQMDDHGTWQIVGNAGSSGTSGLSYGSSGTSGQNGSSGTSGTISATIEYISGSNGIIWTYGSTFATQLPTIGVGIQLNTLTDSIYPLSAKIISASRNDVRVKVYKSVLDGQSVVFSECSSSDVRVHLSAMGGIL